MMIILNLNSFMISLFMNEMLKIIKILTYRIRVKKSINKVVGLCNNISPVI